jgi:hypothetical protein
MMKRRKQPRTRPLNPPDVPPDQKRRALAGERTRAEQSAVFDADDIDHLDSSHEQLGDFDDTKQYEAEMPSGEDQDDELEDLDLLTELELRDGETDDPLEAAEEGMTYVPPIDPPIVPGGPDGAEIASGFGVSALDEPYDGNNHTNFDYDDDEVSARVREALRADSSTTAYADRVAIESNGGVVTLRGVVDDLVDSDNLVGVAGYVAGVTEVVDRLRVRSMGA